MSKEFKAKRAHQAKVRREKEKKRLQTLQQRVNSEGASADIKTEFSTALKKRKRVLNYNKQRMRKSRNELKTAVAQRIPAALERAEKSKKVRQILYSKYKSQDKVRIRKATYRAHKRFNLIKAKIESGKEDINSRCIDFSRTKLTPLGAAVRYSDLEAVRYVLEKKASPTVRCISTLICTPLYDAAWSGKSEIAQLLLDKSAMPEDGATKGALHGAIYNRMFKTIRIMLNRGCQVNEYYLHQTPLGAALTCGKTKSGDVRLVRMLLSAKADIKRETKMCKSPFSVGSMGHHRYLAREYSNQRCRKLLKSVKE